MANGALSRRCLTTVNYERSFKSLGRTAAKSATCQRCPKSNVRFGLPPVIRPKPSDVGSEPIAEAFFSCCVCTQRESCCKRFVLVAAPRLKNRPFERRAAMIDWAIHRSRDRPAVVPLRSNGCIAGFASAATKSTGGDRSFLVGAKNKKLLLRVDIRALAQPPDIQLGRVDKKDSHWGRTVIQAGICYGDQFAPRSNERRRVVAV